MNPRLRSAIPATAKKYPKIQGLYKPFPLFSF